MLTCIEQYYMDKLALHLSLHKPQNIAILGMGEVGKSLYEKLNKSASSYGKVWQLDARYPSLDSSADTRQKNTAWLKICELSLCILVTPIARHNSLLAKLKADNTTHLFLGYQLAESHAGKQWLDEQSGKLFEQLQRFPDESYLWQRYAKNASVNKEQLNAIRQTLGSAPSLS